MVNNMFSTNKIKNKKKLDQNRLGRYDVLTLSVPSSSKEQDGRFHLQLLPIVHLYNSKIEQWWHLLAQKTSCQLKVRLRDSSLEPMIFHNVS